VPLQQALSTDGQVMRVGAAATPRRRALLGGMPHRQRPADPFTLKAVESLRSCIAIDLHRSHTMTSRLSLTAAVAAALLITVSGCAVTRGQETVGAYVDDSAITTAVKARYVESKDVDASSIGVETLNGTVMLTGFAKSGTEKSSAETLALKVNGVKTVKNQIAVRP
jgi:hyperosmotically inducible periplasmic protein